MTPGRGAIAMIGLWCDESGMTSVEYALLLTVLVVGAIIVWRSLGDTVSNSVNRASDTFPDGTGPPSASPTI